MKGRDIVCVGVSDWDNELQVNEHHLMRRLASDNRVLYVESLGLRRPQVAPRDLRRLGRRLVRGLAPPRAVDGLHVLAPLVLPLHGNRVARRLNAEILPRLVRAATRRLDMKDVLLMSLVPQAEVLLGALSPAKVLYFVDDDQAAKKGIDAPSFRAAEQRFARRADAVLATAPELAERMRPLNPNVTFAPNVADTKFFATVLDDGPRDPSVAALPGPRIVFTGAIVANKLDVGLITRMARLAPDWSFVFVGPTGLGDPSTDVGALGREPNVHLLGHRPYAGLPAVLRAGDVAILPYRTDGEMRSVFPMKTYEYLAAGLPLVSTHLPALAGVPEDEIPRAASADEMVARIGEALHSDTLEARVRRSRAAQSHSWETRIALIERAVYGS